MIIQVPGSIKTEHDELHAELAAVMQAGGKVGQAAHSVAQALHPHFLKEEEYALPPLGILKTLVEGTFQADMSAIVDMSDKLRNELGRMLDEHKMIIAELEKLAYAAKAEKKTEYLQFTEKLKQHARMEEEVFYPAAIMVGHYLRAKRVLPERRAS